MNLPREDELFNQVLDRPQDQRWDFVSEICGADQELRHRLEARLAVIEDLENSADQTTAMSDSELISIAASAEKRAAEAVGMSLGRYTLKDKIGEGGCGAVYIAEQTEPVRRLVAIKVIKLGMDTAQVVARFEAERQALAMMDHPNIAKVLDAGTTDNGRPYFVMELVKGNRITDFCDQASLSARDRLDLFVKVCHAIQHAHQKGIIHRDIKPSNILVAFQDGAAVPKVIDFGIAKATDGSLTDEPALTQMHQFVGTPVYMSPEQAEMSGMDIDTRSDIYSLGVLLYELLTGKTPFDAKELMSLGLDGMRKTILEKEPATPSTKISSLQGEELTATAQHRSIEVHQLSRLLKGDLDWIVMKCLEKDRTRRYETANGLAADITRHLNNEPVTARPASAAYKFQKAFRRNRLFFAASASVLLALVIGFLVSIWQARVANLARQAAEAAQLAEKEQRVAAEGARRLAELERIRADDNAERANTNALLARLEATRSTQVANLLKDMLASVNPAVSRGLDTTLLKQVLTNAVSRLDRELGDQPEVEADLRLTLGRTYRGIGDYPTALKMARRALELRRKYPGGRHESVAQALNELAKSLSLLGNLAEAEKNQREALAIRLENLGVNHTPEEELLLGDMYNDLGIILWTQGKPGEARQAYQEALVYKERHLKPPDEKLADARLNLSLLLMDLGEFKEGEAEVREALAGYQALWGRKHPNVGMAMHNEAKLLRELGRTAEAEAAAMGALSIYKDVFGGDHDYVAEALDDLGRIQQDRGEMTQAESSFRDSIAMARRLPGADQRKLLATMRHLALLKASNPPNAEAEELMQSSVDQIRKLFPKDPGAASGALEDQANYLSRTGRLTQAKPALLEAFNAASLGSRPAFERKRLAKELSELCARLGETAEAAKWTAEASAIPAD